MRRAPVKRWRARVPPFEPPRGVAPGPNPNVPGALPLDPTKGEALGNLSMGLGQRRRNAIQQSVSAIMRGSVGHLGASAGENDPQPDCTVMPTTY
jgi:hypothetical protein